MALKYLIVSARDVMFRVVITKNQTIMKKIMMTLATLFVAVCASAQVYIGGGFSLANNNEHE